MQGSVGLRKPSLLLALVGILVGIPVLSARGADAPGRRDVCDRILTHPTSAGTGERLAATGLLGLSAPGRLLESFPVTGFACVFTTTAKAEYVEGVFVTLGDDNGTVAV